MSKRLNDRPQIFVIATREILAARVIEALGSDETYVGHVFDSDEDLQGRVETGVARVEAHAGKCDS